MKSSGSNLFQSLLKATKGWLIKTPERALDEAYEAALTIKSIEDNHFNGNKITVNLGNYSQNGYAYFQAELKKYLNIINIRLSEFKTSSSIFRLINVAEGNTSVITINNDVTDLQTVDIVDKSRAILQKLKFVDEVLVRYGSNNSPNISSNALVEQSEKRKRRRPGTTPISRSTSTLSSSAVERNTQYFNSQSEYNSSNTMQRKDPASFADKTGVLPRSILRTVDRIKRELDPKAEEEVVEAFRGSKSRTIVSLRFILLLIIIPLLTHQVSKNFIVGPIVDSVRGDEVTQVFLNREMEEEALQELQHFEDRLRFEIFIGKSPPLTEEEIKKEVQEEAHVIEEKYRNQSSDAIKNVFADILSVAAFVLVLASSKREISALKTFIDELVYGLSDSAKAFIIILFTDTFVGFHSPHGWEVLLEGVSRHFGLPANRDFIFLFIATFPVILDTVFKYWIFRYLNRISPSAVATYKNMNE